MKDKHSFRRDIEADLGNRTVGRAIPHIWGPHVLEVSFGTGWLLTQYAARYETYGIDLNAKMIQITTSNLRAAGITAQLQRANAFKLAGTLQGPTSIGAHLCENEMCHPGPAVRGPRRCE